MDTTQSVSIILPCLNEAENLGRILPVLKQKYPDIEILVVDDGSTDNSGSIAEQHGAVVIKHPYNMGNGASIKTGARYAQGDILIFMDSDGQHNPEYIPLFIEKINQGFEMVIGARKPSTQASLARRLANSIFNKLASTMTGFRIEDLTSGFRAVNADKFRRFLYLLPNGFSYPTTSTMAFLRSGFPVTYIPIEADTRKGKSKISPLRDGGRFLIIIIKIGALFSPMRFFLPISIFFFLIASFYYAYTYITADRFTNMSALLFITSLLTFLIGILSEQISSLHYRHSGDSKKITRKQTSE